MNVLMLGWEFPPHISGGLGTACYGITKALSANPGINLTFVVPKAWGDEPVSSMKLVGANKIDLLKSKIKTERFHSSHTQISVQSRLVPYIDPEEFKKEQVKRVEMSYHGTSQSPEETIKFSGAYTPDLMTEIHNFSVIAEYISSKSNFDLIHAHDWLTFPAGILAKKATGKPLIIHVHATDFDRSGGNVNPSVFDIEKAGMEAADRIITVSNHTAKMVSEKYGIHPLKISTVHNGVESFKYSLLQKKVNNKIKLVTFLGRITIQKGPQYFVEVARKVLPYLTNVKFVMAGSGDMLEKTKNLVSQYGLNDKFLFPGFLKGQQVNDLLSRSDLFIMPSLSEPFGICPLEAMQFKVPVIISKQSGVSEVINNAIKVDFWDIDAMADAVYGILTRPALAKILKKRGAREVEFLDWEKASSKIIRIYDQILCA